MILWRRKSEGFEWHKHVRTTIRIRREHRRQQLEEARAYALEGLKSAGRAGLAVVGAWLSLIGRLVMSAGHFVGRLARSAANSFQSGILRLIEGLPAVWEGARLYASQALAAAWRIIRRSAEVGAYALLWTSKAVAEIASHGLSAFGAIFSASLVRACGPIQSRGVQPLLIIVGAIATVAALVRLVSAGLSADAILTLVIGLASLLTAALPRLLGVSTTTSESWGAHPQPAWQGGRLTIPRPSIPDPECPDGRGHSCSRPRRNGCGGRWMDDLAGSEPTGDRHRFDESVRPNRHWPGRGRHWRHPAHQWHGNPPRRDRGARSRTTLLDSR